MHRRRGAALEDALLEATWQELLGVGYATLTVEAVANRAGTSRPVIYRRWATKPELVRAAVRHATRRDDLETPDTGSLRGDLLVLMRYANQHRIPLSVTLTYHLGGYFEETGTSPADLREALLGDRDTVVDTIIDRAVARGEIESTRLTPRRRTLAFDLLRHEALMTLAPVPDETLEEILDDVFLPLLLAERR